MDPTTQVISTVGGTLAIFGAFAAWLVRYMDRRFEEVKAETQRQLSKAGEDTRRRFAESRQLLAEAKENTQRQFAESRQLLAEAREDTQRQFAESRQLLVEAREDTQHQFAESRQLLVEAREDTQRQFAESRQLLVEAKEDTRRGFHEMHEAFHRLDDKLDAQGERIADLRQEVGRLQGVVERSFQPDRFTVSAGREAAAGE